MKKSVLTPEFISKVYEYATDGEKCLHFHISDKDDRGIYCAVAVVEYAPENLRVNKFYFIETENPTPSDYFGTGSGFWFAGSTSAPVEKIGAEYIRKDSGKVERLER